MGRQVIAGGERKGIDFPTDDASHLATPPPRCEHPKMVGKNVTWAGLAGVVAVFAFASCGSDEPGGGGGVAGADSGVDGAAGASGTTGGTGGTGVGGTGGVAGAQGGSAGSSAGAAGSAGTNPDAGLDADGEADAPPSLVIYASPNGAGSICTEAEPCPLTTARDLARTKTPTMAGDIAVILRGGTYRLDETFEMTQLDSGQNGHRVLYQAHPGEVPVLSGGREVYGWTSFDAAKGIVRAQVGASLRTRQLYVNGQRAQRARGPLYPQGWSKTANGYAAPDASMAGWAHPDDAEIVQLTYWKNFRCGVASVQGSSVTMEEPCWQLSQKHQGFEMGAPSWVENARELLDVPGEWYLDTHANYLYYVLRPGESASSIQVVVPVLETLVRVAGTLDEPVRDLRIEGLTFTHGTWLRPNSPDGYPALQAGYFWAGTAANPTFDRIPGNVVLHRAENVVLARNVFTRLGAYALDLEYGCHDVIIEGNVVRDVSAGGIRVGDIDRPTTTDSREVATNNLIRNNYVTDTGREYFDGVGIFAGYTDGTRILHNVLHNLSYSAISVGWGWSTAPTVARNNEVAFNRASHAMQRLEDGGMTYTLSKQPGSSIHDNHFHDQVHTYGSIYLDQGSMHFDVTRNVIASTPFWYILQPVVAPAAQDNVVRHNFADTASAYCCGPLGCCTDVNEVSDNTFYAPGQLPLEARYIVHRAGLQPAYQSILGSTVRIEAEDYAHGGPDVSYVDLTPGNAGSRHRDDDVDVYACPTCSNDLTVGYTETGEWLDYHLDVVRPATHDFVFFVGTQSDDCAIELLMNGNVVGTVALPDTGSWSTLATATIPGVRLNAGVHRLRLQFTGAFGFDRFEARGKPTTCQGPADISIDGKFDGTGAVNTLGIHQGDACWSVLSGGVARPWLVGWGAGNRTLVGDYDGDGRQDVLVIVQSEARWHLALSSGVSFSPFPEVLTGWGTGTHEVVGDLDGDGRDDVVVIYFDGTQWRWHVAHSRGFVFDPKPSAHVGTAPGTKACARDLDNDGAMEVVVAGTGQGRCAYYDAASGTFSKVEACSESCP